MRPALTRQYIVATALAIIDREGIGGLSMRKLGAELGVDPMAVYHHLPNKAALFDGVVEAIYHEIDLDAMAGGTWREQAEWFMRRLRDALYRHPKTLPIVSTRPTTTPGMLAVLDRGLGRLLAAGLTGQSALDLVNCLAAYTIGHAIADVGEPVGGESVPLADVAESMTPQTHPHLTQVLEGGFAYEPDEQYELGLQAMLDGFERRLSADRPPPDTP